MTVSQQDLQIFSGVFECVDLKDLPDAISEGVRALQRANPGLAKRARLDALAIDLREVGGKTAS